MHHILSQFLLLIASFIIIKKYKRLKNTQFSLGWKLKEVLNKAIEDGDITKYFWTINIYYKLKFPFIDHRTLGDHKITLDHLSPHFHLK